MVRSALLRFGADVGSLREPGPGLPAAGRALPGAGPGRRRAGPRDRSRLGRRRPAGPRRRCPAVVAGGTGRRDPRPIRQWKPVTTWWPPRALHGYLWSAGLLIRGPWVPGTAGCRCCAPPMSWSGPAGRCGVRSRPVRLPGGRRRGRRHRYPRARLRGSPARRAAPGGRGTVRPLLAALRPQLRPRPRPVGHGGRRICVSGLWCSGPGAGRGMNTAPNWPPGCFPSPPPPLPGGALPPAATIDHPGPDRLTRTRIGCYMAYAVRPEETCSTCPRLKAEGRAAPVAAPAGA